MKTKFLLIAAILFGMGMSNADAQVKQRSHAQKQRIHQGVKSGELTKAEKKNLIADRKEIHQDVKLAKADGKITAGERKIIKKEQKKESREIYRKKHNNRDRD
ncbi:MAG: hypothetical protein ABIN97_07295 [Ginsengibacter sp.]